MNLDRNIVIDQEFFQKYMVEPCTPAGYYEGFDFLSKTALDLVELSPDVDIYTYLGEKLNGFLKNTIVVVNSIDVQKSKLCMKSLTGIGSLMDKIFTTLGSTPRDMNFMMTDDSVAILKTGRLYKLTGGIQQLTFGSIPAVACYAVEKMLDISNIYTIGLVRKDVLFGSLVIITRHGEYVKNIDLVEAYVKQATIAIQRRHTELELRKSENKYRSLIDNAFDAIYVLRGRYYEYVNHRFCQITGYTYEELTSKDFDYNVFLTEKTMKFMADRYEARKNGQEIPNEYQIQIRSKSGDLIDLEVSTVSIAEPGEVAVLGIMRDITERKRSEEKIHLLNKELEQRVKERTAELEATLESLNEEIAERRAAEEKLLLAKEQLSAALQSEKELSELKTRFIEMISHEYRTPLTVIQSSAQIIEYLTSDLNQQDINTQTYKISRSVKQMTELLEDIFAVEMNTNKKVRVSKNLVDVEALTSEIIEDVKTADKNLHPVELIVSGVNAPISTDANLLRNIIINLLLNATKYSLADMPITVSLNAGDGILALRVDDCGCGIPDDEIQHLFEPFYRGKTHIGLIPGTGLGLTTVQRCVDALEGSIRIENSSGSGTSFIVEIPV